jgi:hypothetical protein
MKPGWVDEVDAAASDNERDVTAWWDWREGG